MIPAWRVTLGEEAKVHWGTNSVYHHSQTIPPINLYYLHISDEDEAPSIASSSQAIAGYWPQRPVFDNLLYDEDQGRLSQAIAQYWPQHRDLNRSLSYGDYNDNAFLVSTQERSIHPSDTPPTPYTPQTYNHPVDETYLAVDDSVPEPTLCDEQQHVVDLIMAGKSAFYTGSAGCGKSAVLKAAVTKLREAQKTVHPCTH
ncbi:ATP-dependent DNA helicase PIF1 [Fusarium beomiforme]|uniref:ATP-dependent DNA helicase PIF1 n=1 Tax=Fusarium beomiforme TaxID=44412 RepID=A0A9P5A8E5_9HYPO|nr:ATP-dependent DNA helicase PIF1 [Fusarium beomiforme]